MPSTDAPRLVVDASGAVHLVLAAGVFKPLQRYALHAPALLWSEATSTVRELAFRDELALDGAQAALRRLEELPIAAHATPDLRRRAFQIAVDLGWAKTYDAEYVALAELLDAPLLTVDERLRRRVASRVRCIGPLDL